MNAGFFNVLHDPADHHIFPVGKRIYIHFNRIFEKMIDQYRPVVRVLDRLFHISNYGLFVVGDHHGATA